MTKAEQITIKVPTYARAGTASNSGCSTIPRLPLDWYLLCSAKRTVCGCCSTNWGDKLPARSLGGVREVGGFSLLFVAALGTEGDVETIDTDKAVVESDAADGADDAELADTADEAVEAAVAVGFEAFRLELGKGGTSSSSSHSLHELLTPRVAAGSGG
jgi:hypothetical protein